MVTGRREFRRTTSLTQITVDLTAVKQPVSDYPVMAQRKGQESDSSNCNPMGATESPPPRDYTRMRRRSINIPTPRNYYNYTNITYTEDDTSSFLTTCGLCQRRLPPGRDIFMYRGDTAYCSVECREEQMEHDERKEECSSSIHTDHDLSSHILDHSPTTDPAAAKPSTVAAA